ncbi:CDP-alcohol phosphatidyltransferase family protein [Pasteurella skyensis]|uniref:CDP-alcohol phosphatidyltransferase family protein n=1 Tax=Phocoenobacter skyensis TaxID=97481 RepID=UPI00276AD2F2|nr:CDP-alcohol phosphatidyltransferase family protein [Pasteurella skyensis]MDP8176091.1 CDP-alcohol phosphatidyltransferase family protein [Pasteurella skyensis]MDP8198690.1 CDP-alcohol phosphatidyltransferase family protein [Pasteurella skyensis]
MQQEHSRRELKVRSAEWVKKVTAYLVKTNITPNQISILSIIFSALAGLSFYAFSATSWIIWFALAAIFIQLRLQCNLFDGLVAVEGGKGTKSGELFNDIPDRFADVFILLGAGLSLNSDYGVHLGWIAGLLAVMTAYVRTLGGSLGAPISFMGPMAKQHRMAILTIAALLSMFEFSFYHTQYLLLIALWVIILGSLFTCYRRAKTIYHFLENKD